MVDWLDSSVGEMERGGGGEGIGDLGEGREVFREAGHEDQRVDLIQGFGGSVLIEEAEKGCL